MTKLLFKTSLSQDDVTSNNREKLFSYTIKVPSMDPLDFYQYQEEVYKGKRFFWKSSDDQFTIIGLGVAASFSGDSNDRYCCIEKQWKQLLAVAEINNPFSLPGTGPLLFGGFSFDTESIKETKWSSYGDALFYLPFYMLTIFEGQCYFTVNRINTFISDEEMQAELQNMETFQPAASGDHVSVTSKKEYFVHEWLQAVNDIVADLKVSEQQKVVLARKMKVAFHGNLSSTNIIEQLLLQQPSSFIYAMENEESCFLGASPERLIKKIDHTIFSTCLAGSIGRGKTDEEDHQLGEKLLQDQKNLYEHELVVAMIEDALKKFCEQIHVPDHPILMKTRDIQHLYTPVVGQGKKEQSIFEIIKELHPTPALGGVPTKAAMKIIRDHENMDRGFYSSPIGWCDYRNNGEFVVGIRSGLIRRNEAYLYAGCGLVADSVAEEELIETRMKFRPMLRAIGGE